MTGSTPPTGAAENPDAADRAAGPPPEMSALGRYRAAARQTRRETRRRTRDLRSGPRADSRDPQRVSAVFRRMTDELGWTRDMAVWSLTHRWHEIVGPQVAGHVTVERFEQDAGEEPAPDPSPDPKQQSLLETAPDPAPPRGGGLLTLRADSHAWKEQIVWNLADLQRRLDEELGPGVVGRVVVLGPEPPKRSYGRFRVTR